MKNRAFFPAPLLVLAIGAMLLLAACGSHPDKQWQVPEPPAFSRLATANIQVATFRLSAGTDVDHIHITASNVAYGGTYDTTVSVAMDTPQNGYGYVTQTFDNIPYGNADFSAMAHNGSEALVAEASIITYDFTDDTPVTITMLLYDTTGAPSVSTDAGPSIIGLTMNPSNPVINQDVELTVVADHPTGDTLSYLWSKEVGAGTSTFDPNNDTTASTTTWNHDTAENVTVKILVSDTMPLTDEYSFTVTIGSGGKVDLSGYVVPYPYISGAGVLDEDDPPTGSPGPTDFECVVTRGGANATCLDTLVGPNPEITKVQPGSTAFIALDILLQTDELDLVSTDEIRTRSLSSSCGSIAPDPSGCSHIHVPQWDTPDNSITCLFVWTVPTGINEICTFDATFERTIPEANGGGTGGTTLQDSFTFYVGVADQSTWP